MGTCRVIFAVASFATFLVLRFIVALFLLAGFEHAHAGDRNVARQNFFDAALLALLCLTLVGFYVRTVVKVIKGKRAALLLIANAAESIVSLSGYVWAYQPNTWQAALLAALTVTNCSATCVAIYCALPPALEHGDNDNHDHHHLHEHLHLHAAAAAEDPVAQWQANVAQLQVLGLVGNAPQPVPEEVIHHAHVERMLSNDSMQRTGSSRSRNPVSSDHESESQYFFY